MVRINGSKLIIEIPCNSQLPLEKLSSMQIGLMNLIGIIDHTDAPKLQVHEGLFYLRELLKESILDERQSAILNEHIVNNHALQKEF